MPYHTKKIPKGVLCELSKVYEECLEAMDADEQNNPVMVLLELSDIIGAIDSYLRKYYPTITLGNLIRMSEATKSAFQDGTRKG